MLRRVDRGASDRGLLEMCLQERRFARNRELQRRFRLKIRVAGNEGLTSGRVLFAVGGGGTGGAAAAGGGTELEAEHRESARAVAHEHFGEENLAKTGNIDRVAGRVDARIVQMDVAD